MIITTAADITAAADITVVTAIEEARGTGSTFWKLRVSLPGNFLIHHASHREPSLYFHRIRDSRHDTPGEPTRSD
jgi:hypothetical protein